MTREKSNGNRVTYLDGLKGVMALVVIFTHYMLALYPKGYVGFGSGVTGDVLPVVKEGFPESLFSNSSISLYLFFSMISFFIVVSFRRNKGSITGLRRQAAGRYIQFVIPVFAATVLAYVLYETGILQYERVAEMTDAPWSLAIIPATDDPFQMLYMGLFGIYFHNKIDILTVLWCMHVIFIGSYLTYGMLALFGGEQQKMLCYLAFFALTFVFPQYFVFATGALNGELFDQWHKRKQDNTTFFGKPQQLVSGSVVLIVGICLGLIPSPCLPSGISLYLSYGCATFLILFGLMLLPMLQKLLSWTGFVVFGKYLFSLILVHIFVLYTFSAWFYAQLNGVIPSRRMLFLITYVVSLVVVMAVAKVFYECFEKPSRLLSKKWTNWIMKEDKGEKFL